MTLDWSWPARMLRKPQPLGLVRHTQAVENAAEELGRPIRHPPVPRSSLLELIWHQDEIADLCQDAALLMSLRRPDLSIELEDGFRTLGESLVRVVHEYHLAVEAFEEALASGLSQGKLKEVQEGIWCSLYSYWAGWWTKARTRPET